MKFNEQTLEREIIDTDLEGDFKFFVNADELFMISYLSEPKRN